MHPAFHQRANISEVMLALQAGMKSGKKSQRIINVDVVIFPFHHPRFMFFIYHSQTCYNFVFQLLQPNTARN